MIAITRPKEPRLPDIFDQHQAPFQQNSRQDYQPLLSSIRRMEGLQDKVTSRAEWHLGNGKRMSSAPGLWQNSSKIKTRLRSQKVTFSRRPNDRFWPI